MFRSLKGYTISLDSGGYFGGKHKFIHSKLNRLCSQSFAVKRSFSSTQLNLDDEKIHKIILKEELSRGAFYELSQLTNNPFGKLFPATGLIESERSLRFPKIFNVKSLSKQLVEIPDAFYRIPTLSTDPNSLLMNSNQKNQTPVLLLIAAKRYFAENAIRSWEEQFSQHFPQVPVCELIIQEDPIWAWFDPLFFWISKSFMPKEKKDRTFLFYPKRASESLYFLKKLLSFENSYIPYCCT